MPCKKNILTVLLAVLAICCGCDKDKKKSPSPEKNTALLPSSQAQAGSKRHDVVLAAAPFLPVGPPPHVQGPGLPDGTTPGKYATAAIGMKVTHRHTHGKDVENVITTEVTGLDCRNVYVRQTVRTKTGEFVNDMSFNRYYSAGAVHPEPVLGKCVGTRQFRVAGKTLPCDVYEKKAGGKTYRTLVCPDILGGIVQFADDFYGTMTVRMELIGFRE